MPKIAAVTVHSLKVALKGQKSIWRLIEIRDDQTLDDLHEAIFSAFERDDEHLYSFYLPKPGTRGRSRLTGAKEFTHPSCVDGFGGQKDASQTTLDDLRLRVRGKFEYLFDFGDSWWHEITVESKSTVLHDGSHPRVVKKRGKAPPQYEDLDEEYEGPAEAW